METLIFSLFGNNTLVHNISTCLDAKVGNLSIRHFPDEETYVKINETIQGKNVVIVASLERPNSKFLPLTKNPKRR